jgi:hypothetical protein
LPYTLNSDFSAAYDDVGLRLRFSGTSRERSFAPKRSLDWKGRLVRVALAVLGHRMMLALVTSAVAMLAAVFPDR